jgi:hypothetical protein
MSGQVQLRLKLEKFRAKIENLQFIQIESNHV